MMTKKVSATSSGTLQQRWDNIMSSPYHSLAKLQIESSKG
jgi:hypothetical protein